jgi:hypothetical protein
MYFIFSSAILIGSDIYVLKSYEVNGESCIPVDFTDDPIIYGIWWIFNRFISVISVNLLSVVLFWRFRIKQDVLNMSTFENIKRKRDEGN